MNWYGTRLGAALGCALGLLAGPLRAQEHVHGSATAAARGHVGAHGVLLGTHVRNGVGGRPETEAYLTQPTLFAGGAYRALSAHVAVSLEGLTLERGELAPGTYGEGYIDRRHPHTYLHEAVLTVQSPAASMTIGRGFAPFGTDDPMLRPFVRFPVNHHLGQVLERLIAVAAVRRGPVLLEAGVFNGDEPSSPSDFGTPSRFADSWSARATLLPRRGIEVQASHARVESPETPLGTGWDQYKWSASARYERAGAYGLLEWKRTSERDDDGEVFAFGSVLAEGLVTRGEWVGAVRVERTDRPEEERISRYRSPWPHSDQHVLGITRWTIASLHAERVLRFGGAHASPFAEASFAHVGDRVSGLVDPEELYGSRRIWSVSAGVRLGAGSVHARMGRYGVAQN